MPYVHKWEATPLADGSHRYHFTGARCPPFKAPAAFPEQPRCPPDPGPPSDEFLKGYLQEDREWERWTKEENAQLAAEMKAIAAEKAARKTRKEEEAKAAARKGLSDLDCPAKAGFTTKIDEGDAIIARCGGGKGSHTLPLRDLVAVVANLRFSAESFTEFVHREKQKFVGQDVNAIVGAYMEVTPLPDAKEIEAELAAYEKGAKEKTQRGHEVRINFKQAQMKERREEARNSPEAKSAWCASLVSTPEWQSFLTEAESWIKECESLNVDWDEYDHARRLVEADLGEARGFVMRPELMPNPADWFRHPVLGHATAHSWSVVALAQRWQSLCEQRQ